MVSQGFGCLRVFISSLFLDIFPFISTTLPYVGLYLLYFRRQLSAAFNCLLFGKHIQLIKQQSPKSHVFQLSCCRVLFYFVLFCFWWTHWIFPWVHQVLSSNRDLGSIYTQILGFTGSLILLYPIYSLIFPANLLVLNFVLCHLKPAVINVLLMGSWELGNFLFEVRIFQEEILVFFLCCHAFHCLHFI